MKLDSRQLQKNKLSLVIVVLIVIAGGATFLLNANDASNQTNSQVKSLVEETKNFSSRDGTISFNYSSSLTSQSITEVDVQDGFLFRATSQSPPALVSLKKETGLKKVTAVANTDIINLLSENLLRVYPQRFSGFKLMSQNKVELSGKPGKNIIFTYDGPSGEKVTQRLVIIDNNGNDAYLIAMQTVSLKFDNLNEKIFNQVINNINIL